MPGACVFCKIAAGEIPATVVKRGDGMLAFRDLNPQAPTHVLVIPTDHVASLNDAKDPRLLGGLLAFAREVARAPLEPLARTRVRHGDPAVLEADLLLVDPEDEEPKPSGNPLPRRRNAIPPPPRCHGAGR